MDRYVRIVFLCSLLVCSAFAHGDFGVVAQAAANASVTVTATTAAVAGEGAGAASAPVNTFFRKQDQIITSDASTEDKIPGLEATDHKQTWKAMPNVEHLSPFITMFTPLLPTMMKVTKAMGIFFPMEWPLAGSSGQHEPWMQHALKVYSHALLGKGPKPRIAPTILVPTHEAYKKLAADIKQYAGLPDIASVHEPAKKALLAAAVFQQLLSNLVVVAAPKLETAENGTLVMTHGKQQLVLEVRPDGSRYLVSNTTSLKLVAMDIGCKHCGQYTIQLVDSFLVPKMSPVPLKHDPLISQEDIQRMPEYLSMVKEGLTNGPKALHDMPGAWMGMLVRQLPDKHQEHLKELSKLVPKLDVAVTKNP